VLASSTQTEKETKAAMNERLTGLKRVAVFGAAFGAGVVLTVALVLGMVHWYQSRPEPWRTNTVVGLAMGPEKLAQLFLRP